MLYKIRYLSTRYYILNKKLKKSLQLLHDSVKLNKLQKRSKQFTKYSDKINIKKLLTNNSECDKVYKRQT